MIRPLEAGVVASQADDKVALSRASEPERNREAAGHPAVLVQDPGLAGELGLGQENALGGTEEDLQRQLEEADVLPLVAGEAQQGDLQVPEGFYTIDLFNPTSAYHLSIRVSYPNESDRILGRRPLGGAIMVHGNCVSIGCIAIEDEPIEELYLMTLDAKRRMGRNVPIHIFPRQLDEKGLAQLEKTAGSDAALLAFWRGLEPGFSLFEQTRRPPRVSVDLKTGAYTVRAGR